MVTSREDVTTGGRYRRSTSWNAGRSSGRRLLLFVLGIVRLRTGSLLPCMLLHALYNLGWLIHDGILQAL